MKTAAKNAVNGFELIETLWNVNVVISTKGKLCIEN